MGREAMAFLRAWQPLRLGRAARLAGRSLRSRFRTRDHRHIPEFADDDRIVAPNLGYLRGCSRRRNDRYMRSAALVPVEWQSNQLHAIPIRRRDIVANQVVLIVGADSPLRTGFSQCCFTCVAPACISRPQI